MDNSKPGKGLILHCNLESRGVGGGEGDLWKSRDIYCTKSISGEKTLTLKC